jgi:hypothetical protein
VDHHSPTLLEEVVLDALIDPFIVASLVRVVPVSRRPTQMSDQTESNQPKLSITDPVDSETLRKFQQLQASRLQVAENLLNIEQDKIRLIRAASNIETERQRLFEGVLLARGLPPNYPVEIDAKTGVMKPVEEAMEAFNQQASAQAQAALQAQAAANQSQAAT